MKKTRKTGKRRTVSMEGADIGFVHLGIYIQNLKNSISIFGFRVAYYGIIIGCGMLAGIWIAHRDAKRRGQDPEMYTDLALYGIICSIIGARLYYVIFSWDYYKDNLLEILNLRGGGLAIYGGVLAAVLTLFVFTRVRKVSFLSLADTGVLGLITGQIIGRWGNFFNCEAFGGYTDSLLAMRIKLSLVNANMLNQDVLAHKIVENGIEYIQVHPTFLYESVWNLGVLCFMLWYRNYKKFDGEILCLYFFGYGLGRFWIESLRTDSLMLFGTGIAVSQALSLLLMILGGGMMLYQHRKLQNSGGETI
jgi:phosphatidylglycerol:prolipoprotein diacylglycerol transferase